MSPRARVAKNRARLQRYEQMASQDAEKRDEAIVLQIPPGPHLGTLVVEAAGLAKGYGDNLLFEGMSFRLPPGGIIGVIGPNGAGKTTLFRMIVGQETPDRGTLRIGDSVVISYVDQNRDALAPREHGLPGDHRRPGPDRAGQAQGARAGLRGLSSTSRGPTRRRRWGSSPAASGTASTSPSCSRAAATCCSSTSRPTTSTSRCSGPSRKALVDFGGCAVVISHDRWFLDRIATHILAFEGDSQVVWCDGNYQTYEAQRHERLGLDADQPHRIRYKSLTR